MKKTILFVATLLSIASTSVFAVPDKQPTMAVLPFVVGSKSISISANIGELNITEEIVESEFTNQLTEFLVRSRKFNVLNRTNMNRIMDENKLTQSEWAKPGQEQYVGKLLVSDFLVTGNINRLEIRAYQQDIAITGERSIRLSLSMKCQYKVTEVATGKIVAAGQAVQTLHDTDIRRMYSARERRDWTIGDYRDILFRTTVDIVGGDILAGIYPIKVATIQNTEITLNRGEGAGLAVGQRLVIFNVGSNMVVDPDTQEVLGSQEKQIGLLEIVEVTPKYSKARLLSNTEVVQPGAICKPLRMEQGIAIPEYPRATPGW